MTTEAPTSIHTALAPDERALELEAAAYARKIVWDRATFARWIAQELRGGAPVRGAAFA